MWYPTIAVPTMALAGAWRRQFAAANDADDDDDDDDEYGENEDVNSAR